MCFAAACKDRAELACEKQQWSTALDWFRQAIRELEIHRKNNPNHAELAGLLGSCLKMTGDIHYEQQNRSEAVACWESAVSLFRQVLTTSPNKLLIHHQLGGTLHNLSHADYAT
ncbi:MAG TPA: hypothetical protein PKD72_16750, partial [Gemmatales bacterium]|nr:hypothetical protein [Gemmatales bacterium]